MSAAVFSPDFHSRQLRPDADPDALDAAQALRYRVYCEECGFLPGADYPQQRESDRYDAHSAHFGTFNTRDELVGFARLVHPDADQRFPCQDFCERFLAGFVRPPVAESAEISRLMVRADYRRRRGDTLAGVTTPGEAEATAADVERRRVASPQILLGLYRQMYGYSLERGVRYWYAAMERPLARALAQLSFQFEPISEAIDYFGPVACYIADLRELERRVAAGNPLLMAWMQSVVAERKAAAPARS